MADGMSEMLYELHKQREELLYKGNGRGDGRENVYCGTYS